MIKVYAEYVNKQNKAKEDFFIWKRVVVEGHASNTGYGINRLVCASISAVTGGIKELLSFSNYQVEIKKGYFEINTDINVNRDRTAVVSALGRTYIDAVETLIWQLWYIYKSYPTAFKSFEMVDVKGEVYDDERTITRPKRIKGKRRYNTLGVHSLS